MSSPRLSGRQAGKRRSIGYYEAVILDYFSELIIVAVLAASPVLELRAAIPYGVGVLKMPLIETFIIAVAANTLAAIAVYLLLDRAVRWIFRKFPHLEERVANYFLKLHAKHSPSFNKWGAFFLILFIAVPLPGTGAWSGALLAYLFNIPFKFAAPAIFAGVFGAGAAVAALTGLIF